MLFCRKIIVPTRYVVGRRRTFGTQGGRRHTARQLGTACGLSVFLAKVVAAYEGRPGGPDVTAVLPVAVGSRLGNVMGVGTLRSAKSFPGLGDRLGTFGRLLVVPYAVQRVRVTSHEGIFVVVVGRCVGIVALPA